MPSGKKKKRHKMSTHKRKKRLRKNRHKSKKLCLNKHEILQSTGQNEKQQTFPASYLKFCIL